MIVYPRDDPEYQKEFRALAVHYDVMLDDARNVMIKKRRSATWLYDVAMPAIGRVYQAKLDALIQRYGLPPKIYYKP